jgi:tetratricopeptide (TPR) repeat protein
MPSHQRDLLVFLALPYTSLGEGAGFKTSEGVIERFIKPAIEKLQTLLMRKVQLIVEAEVREPGDIISSMFEHAWTADVYIADLTGANANVFLELGVRWALRESVTVITSQDVDRLKFNVSIARVVQYRPDTLPTDIDNLVDVIFNGLQRSKCDSLVRQNLLLEVVSKSDYNEQLATIARLRGALGEQTLRAAARAKTLPEKIQILTRGADISPNSLQILQELGFIYKEDNKFEEAIRWFRRLLKLDLDNAVALREIGVCFSKSGAHEDACRFLKKALVHAPEDFDALCNLGGALRRFALEDAPEKAENRLEEAREQYIKAHKIEKFDHYAGMNVWRVTLLLSKWRKSETLKAEEGFRTQSYLCRYIADQNPLDYWLKFDLAETMLFTKNTTEARKVFSSAVGLVPDDLRAYVFTTVAGPLKDYTALEVVRGNIRSGVNGFIAMLQRGLI